MPLPNWRKTCYGCNADDWHDSYDCGGKMELYGAFVKRYGFENIMLGTKFRGKIEEIIKMILIEDKRRGKIVI